MRQMRKNKPTNLGSFRQKVIEAMVFFAQKGKLKNPSKMMMYKLLAEVDFRHFQETGLTVTNLRYVAYPKGPVPKSLHEEITKDGDLVLPDDFASALNIQDTYFEDAQGKKHPGFKYIAKREPELKLFSPRQQGIFKEVAEIYRDSTATEASDASHEQGKPWTLTVKKHGQGATIDPIETLELIKPLTKETAKELLREREALIYNYGELGE